MFVFQIRSRIEGFVIFLKQTKLKKYTKRNILFTELLDTTVSQGCVGRDECDF